MTMNPIINRRTFLNWSTTGVGAILPTTSSGDSGSSQ